MSQTIFAKQTNNSLQTGDNYVRENSDYLSPLTTPLKKEYKIYELEEKKYTNVDLIKKTFKTLIEQINDREELDINSKVSQFLSTNYKGTLEYSLIENPDSNYYTVSIRSDNLSFQELFGIARNLNRDAVRQDLDFTVIAGV